MSTPSADDVADRRRRRPDEPHRFTSAEAIEVSKVFGRQRALHRVSLRIEAGSVTALMGPNGAGKTTLLDLFSTLSRPSAGRMRFGDLPSGRSAEARGGIGIVSHAPLSYRDLSAQENVALFGRLYGVEDPDGEAAARLVEFGLEHAAHRLAKTFSRGMRQRLGLARALVGRPSLLLLDEPFTGLDRASTETVIERVARLRDEGTMVLMVSHDVATTAELADRAVVLRRGRIVGENRGRLDAPALSAFHADALEHPSRGGAA